MAWFQYLGYLVAGGLLANSLPHLAMGITGQRFQTPFGRNSSAPLNVAWGFVNLVFFFLLLSALGWTERAGGPLALGFLLSGLGLSFYFSRGR